MQSGDHAVGNADYYLRGDGTWTTSQMASATGTLPAPPAGQQNSYLRGDGTWVQTNNARQSQDAHELPD